MAAPTPVTNLEPTIRVLTSYSDVADAFRSPGLVAKPDPSDPFASATVRWIHGNQHVARRRALSRLLMRGGDRWFRENILFPTTERSLGDLLAAPDPDGYARTDLYELGNRLFIRQSAAMAGFRALETTAEAADLYRLLEKIRDARQMTAGGKKSDVVEIATETLDPEEVRRIMEAGLDAKREIRDRYFRPALEDHRQMIARVEAGELDASQLPRDFLAVIAALADPEWSDEDLALREVITDTLSAGVDTSVQLLCRTANQIFKWIDGHPGQEDRCVSADFIKGALNETLRLEIASAGFIRTAVEDVVLSSGLTVKLGERVVLDRLSANRDRDVFGADAEVFDPDRTVPEGVLPYGLAFGAGAHMCFGQPLVIGRTDAEGTHDYLFKRLFELRMQRDPDLNAATNPNTITRKFVSLPVRFPVRA